MPILAIAWSSMHSSFPPHIRQSWPYPWRFRDTSFLAASTRDLAMERLLEPFKLFLSSSSRLPLRTLAVREWSCVTPKTNYNSHSILTYRSVLLAFGRGGLPVRVLLLHAPLFNFLFLKSGHWRRGRFKAHGTWKMEDTSVKELVSFGKMLESSGLRIGRKSKAPAW